MESLMKRVAETYSTGRTYLPDPEKDYPEVVDPHELCYGIGSNIGCFPRELIGQETSYREPASKIQRYF